MLRVLLESEEGKALYHQYLDQLVSQWIESGKMEAEVNRLADMIRPWMEQETISVYSFDEHLQAVDSIQKFTSYRGESIRLQLNGQIPSTWDSQNAQLDSLPDFSDYSPPESGIMKILVPEAEGSDVSMGALLGVLPVANKNLQNSVSLPALMGLIDFKQLLTMERPASDDGESRLSEIPREDLIAAVMPYPVIAAKLLLTALAVPLVLLWGLRFVKRKRKKEVGIRHVV